jgi:cysteinyl-tRNA synthetase
MDLKFPHHECEITAQNKPVLDKHQLLDACKHADIEWQENG